MSALIHINKKFVRMPSIITENNSKMLHTFGTQVKWKSYSFLFNTLPIIQQTVTSAHNGSRWIVDWYFPPPGTIPDDDTTPPGTEYYSRSAPTWSEVYESTTIVVYCKWYFVVLFNIE